MKEILSLRYALILYVPTPCSPILKYYVTFLYLTLFVTHQTL